MNTWKQPSFLFLSLPLDKWMLEIYRPFNFSFLYFDLFPFPSFQHCPSLFHSFTYSTFLFFLYSFSFYIYSFPITFPSLSPPYSIPLQTHPCLFSSFISTTLPFSFQFQFHSFTYIIPSIFYSSSFLLPLYFHLCTCEVGWEERRETGEVRLDKWDEIN